jgi:hypothetical protein
MLALANAEVVPVAGAHTSNLGELKTNVQKSQCTLENCWRLMFPQVKVTIEQGSQILRKHVDSFNQDIAHAELLDQTEPDREEKILRYKLAVIKRYLEECDDLQRGPDEPRHLIIVGHVFDFDGQNTRLAAMTYYGELLVKLCGPPPAGDKADERYERCKRQIVIREDQNKDDLFAYLGMLGTGSVESITYFGHGIANGNVLGPKNLLLPVDWNPSLAINESTWRKINQGMLYSSDLTEFAPTLTRVVAHGAPIKIFACNTAKNLAPSLKRILGDSVIEACLVGMHFQYMDKAGIWHTDWVNPVPLDAAKTRLVPDQPGAFKEIEAPTLKSTIASLKSEAQNEVQRSPASQPDVISSANVAGGYTPADRAARDVVLRLALGAANEAVVDSGRRLVLFTDVERVLLKDLTKDFVHNRHIDPAFNYGEMEQLFSRVIGIAANPDTADAYKRIHAKLNDCVTESIKLYYR